MKTTEPRKAVISTSVHNIGVETVSMKGYPRFAVISIAGCVELFFNNFESEETVETLDAIALAAIEAKQYLLKLREDKAEEVTK